MQKELLDGLITEIKKITGIGDVGRWRNQFEHADRIGGDGQPRGDEPSIRYNCVFIGFVDANYDDLLRGEQLIKDQVFCLHLGYKILNPKDNGDFDFKQSVYYLVQGFSTTHWNRVSRIREEWDEDFNNLRHMRMYFRCSARDKSAIRPKITHHVEPVVPVIDGDLKITNDIIRTDVPL